MSGIVRTHGKCILAGEHGVVRGGEALVLPLKSRGLNLTWESATEPGLKVADGPFAQPFRDSLKKALALTGFLLPKAGYHVRISSDIPVQAGLGSSAALAVALVRFLLDEGAKIQDPFALALEVENIFHGKSSGLDVACVLASSPIRYVKGEPAAKLPLAWSPHFYLFDTGQRSATKECVAKVEAAKRPDLDERMAQSVREMKAALASEDGNDRLPKLAHAIELAQSCFVEWDLGPSPALVDRLKNAGALAVKPTGSGGGGFVLCLWGDAPPPGLGLLPVWEAT